MIPYCAISATVQDCFFWSPEELVKCKGFTRIFFCCKTKVKAVVTVFQNTWGFSLPLLLQLNCADTQDFLRCSGFEDFFLGVNHLTSLHVMNSLSFPYFVHLCFTL